MHPKKRGLYKRYGVSNAYKLRKVISYLNDKVKRIPLFSRVALKPFAR
jgi:hypothetical protein